MSDDTKLLFIKIAWSKANCESYACDDRDDEDGDRSVSHLRWPRAVARVSRRRAHDPRRTCLVCVVSLSPSPVRLSAPRSLGSRGASARSVYNTKAECLSVSKVSPKFARRHGFNTNSCGDSLGRTAMHNTYRPGKKRPMSTRSMWKRNPFNQPTTEPSASSKSREPRSAHGHYPAAASSRAASRARSFEFADRSPGWRASLRADREMRCERAGAKRGRAGHADRRPAEQGSGGAGRTEGRRLRQAKHPTRRRLRCARAECAERTVRRRGGASKGERFRRLRRACAGRGAKGRRLLRRAKRHDPLLKGAEVGTW